MGLPARLCRSRRKEKTPASWAGVVFSLSGQNIREKINTNKDLHGARERGRA
jgi:hypothetical protein